eukprot:3159020-Prymnesium_polylepis.1
MARVQDARTTRAGSHAAITHKPVGECVSLLGWWVPPLLTAVVPVHCLRAVNSVESSPVKRGCAMRGKEAG